MSNPRVKRPFAGAAADPSQRQITSFFGAQSPGQPAEPTTTGTYTRAAAAALPSSVQSNLITVGMRVRKSVPEGYKTKSDSAFKLWTDNRTNIASPNIASPTRPAAAATRPQGQGQPRVVSRELLPFCGINKVGGLDTQPGLDRDDDDGGYYDENEAPGLDDLPELSMSQESNDSVDSHAGSRKRYLQDDDEDEASDFDDVSFSPVGMAADRVISAPRSRYAKASHGVGGGNVGASNDFRDAEFLVFDHGEGMDTAM